MELVKDKTLVSVPPGGEQIPNDFVCGGRTEAMDATEEIQKLCDQMKGKVEEKTKKNYAEFTAVKYTSQTVAGYKYRIKVHVGGTDYIHMGVFQRLDDETELLGVKQNTSKDDAL